MIWIRWFISTCIIVSIIIWGMIYGWGLHPVKWRIVIVAYLLANAWIPFQIWLNAEFDKKFRKEKANDKGSTDSSER